MIIYKVTNKKSGNVYIGQTVKSLEERKHNHFLSSLSKNSKSKFHKAIKSYGIDNFNWEVVDTANSKDELNQKEIQHISEYNSIEDGYNMIDGGTGGYKHSEETIEKIRQSQIGKVIPEETKKLISKRTKEAMAKLDKDELTRKALIGRKKYWDNKHQSDRDLILQLKSKGYSVKKIQSELDISTPTYYKRLNELKKLGLIK